ncbi:hypothetical protein A4A49_35979 [Nicotiana attenuata]|uniref:Uncharacterized protein n=1 Tax=Nicotiana attenuata TaxID=49451 RepID=A0A1J6KGH5_NICAT|nr:hypothetical protein A4A49_35979 [Nicotiana attenuata]
MAATRKTSKQQERDNNNKQPPKKPTGKATRAPKPPNKRKRTEKAKELPTRQLVDESEQKEEEPLVRRTVKRGITTTSSNPPSKGIEIREPVPHQSQPSKQSNSKDKGKHKAVVESEFESDSDDELPHIDMSDEDEGEPIDRAAWEEKFVSDKANQAYDKILGSKKYIPEKPINIGALKKKYPDFLKSIREVQQWGPILKGHGKANLTIVRELYAN